MLPPMSTFNILKIWQCIIHNKQPLEITGSKVGTNSKGDAAEAKGTPGREAPGYTGLQNSAEDFFYSLG